MAALTLATGLGACGDESPAPSSTPETAPRHTSDPTRTRETSPRRRHASDPPPPRLIAGPLLTRLTGTPAPTETDGSPQSRYLLIFRLSRGRKAIRNGRSYGRFLIAGDPLFPYSFGRARKHCFAAVVEGKGAEDPLPARILDKVKPGTRVRVRIQPLTISAGKNKLIERPYIRRPRMRVTGVIRTVAALLLNRPSHFKSPAVRRAIRRLGCA